MANITQTISSLTTGISQQPDEQKIPGQVKNMVNAVPDVVQGLLKRPAGKFVASLSDGSKNSSADGKWFHYYRDENEQYIGQIHRDGTVRMWDCLTGAEKTIEKSTSTQTTSSNATYTRTNTGFITITLSSHGFSSGEVVQLDFTSGAATDGFYTVYRAVNDNTFQVTDSTSATTSGNVTVKHNYLMHVGDEDIQTLTLNDFTYLNNRTKTVVMDDTIVEPDINFGKEIFIELKSISYAKQYAVNIFDTTDTTELTTATRINVELLKSSNNYCNSADGGMLGNGSDRSARTNDGNVRCDDTAGDSRDAYAPNVGTRIFDVEDGGSLTDVAVHDTHTYNVNVFDSANQDVSTLTGNAARSPKNLYFRIATTGQSVPYTTGSGSSQETTYQARYTTTYDLLHGGEGWKKNDYFYVWMKDAYYKVTVEEISTSKVQANLALVRPNPTPFDNETTITAESVLGDIRTAIIAGGNISDSDITTIGNGLHIKRTSTFNASTPVGQLLNVVAGKVNDVGDLPTQCKNGMVVEVVNSAAEEDNYFVKFLGNSGRDGEGVWEECAKPGRKIRLKRSSMPHLLIRTANGQFRLTELDGSTYSIGGDVQPEVPVWDDAGVGDETTNPEPSFVGKTVNKLLFFRNRFCILADEYIVMSRPGDFTNFFAKSAIQFVASDPIDIAASSKYPAVLFDGIQTNTGLVLFSKNQQFMVTTDSDVFSPQTAKINTLSTYNFNVATNPVSLGTTIGFLDNAGKFSRFFEMTQVQREGEPNIIEQSAVVPKLFENDLDLISNSRENQIIFFSEENSSTLYGYRYFDQITERKLASWFKWTLTGSIQYHCIQDDSLYVVVKNNNKDQLLKYAIKLDSNSPTVSEYRVHLDHVREVSNWSYNPTTKKSTSARTNSQFIGLESSNQLALYDNSNNSSGTQNIGRYAKVTINGNNYEVDGDWRNENFLMGYLFTMEVELPTLYYVTKSGEQFKADTRSNTIIHRVKLGFGPVGVYETKLKRLGKMDYNEEFEITAADVYLANTAGIVNDEVIRTVPVYDRNINTTLTLKSTHPAPATIHNVTWEGVLNNNFYQSV